MSYLFSLWYDWFLRRCCIRRHSISLLKFPFIIIIIIIIHSLELFTSALADSFSLESEWRQVSSSFQDSSQYAVVWMVSTRLPISNSSSLFGNPLVTVPNAPITIGIIVTYIFHSFFRFPSKVDVLILLFTFFQLYFVVSWDSKVNYFTSSLFFFFVDYYYVRSSGCDGVICLYIKIPSEFMRVIF